MNAIFSFYTLGRFEIYPEKQGYYNLTGGSTKLWYLFKYLLLNKRKGIPPETILETLYPYEEYENPKNTLQNIVYRLRKVLNQRRVFRDFGCNIVYNNGCYSLSFNDDVFLDTDYFEEYIHKAESLKNINPDEATECYENALKLYCGDYFSGTHLRGLGYPEKELLSQAVYPGSNGTGKNCTVRIWIMTIL